jgi:lipoprotein-anchoring transpeptidase ErfK/SrfK
MKISLPKVILVSSISIFLIIGLIGFIKSSKSKPILEEKEVVAEEKKIEPIEEILIHDDNKPQEPRKEIIAEKPNELTQMEIPQANQVYRLFVTDSSKLPIVETITYTSRVPWLKGRPAWIADYASYYETTRHFIARSLNKKADYFTQKVSPGDSFNVLKKDKDIQFYLIIDLSRLKMLFYAIDKSNNERIHLKTYNVGVGRKDPLRASGYLTPTGKFTLNSKVAIYKPGTMGYFQDRKIEMVRVFGTRWIPFGEDIENCSEPAKGFGLHGTPWVNDKETGLLIEDMEKISKYDSDGCIRLSSQDIEEIFAIVISKPTIVELVKDYFDSDFIKEEKAEKVVSR